MVIIIVTVGRPRQTRHHRRAALVKRLMELVVPPPITRTARQHARQEPPRFGAVTLAIARDLTVMVTASPANNQQPPSRCATSHRST